MRWENVYIFISSTFNDMHAERDYLVKSVFPALSEWCEAHRLRLIDIDLRWGVTAADSEAKNTVRACLRNIDECRPFFLCFMGQRRGWIPNPDDIGEDTYNLFPNLKGKRYAGEASVTEMEILHALIDPLHNGVLRGTKDDNRSGQAVEHAFFYLREPGYLDKMPHSDLRAVYTNESERDKETADKELTRWREEEIPRTGRPVYTYTAGWHMDESTPEIALPVCVPTTSPKDSGSWRQAFIGWQKRWAAVGVKVDESGEIKGSELVKANEYNKAFTHGRLGGFEADTRPLSELIIKQLKEAISKRFPEHMAPDELTPLQKELDQQAQFQRLAGDGFIERTGDFDALYEYINGDEKRPFALTAFAGMGKTSLLAHFIDTYSTENGESLHFRFIGGSDGSVSTERLIRSLLDELKEAGKIESEIPANAIDMMNKLPDFLAEAGKIGKTVIIIDALNQLESGMEDLYWIPSDLPENVKLIVSFKRGEINADEYYKLHEDSGDMILHTVKPFDSEDDRKALVVAYLETYFKELDEPRIQSLINSEGADNPLFLKAALSELRVFGVHNDLTEVIKNRFGKTPVTAFNAILARMESDAAYTRLTPAVMLPHLFGFIAHSRYGLSVDELAEISVREKLTDNKSDAFDAIYLIIRQLRPFLARRDGRVDFFYESFKIAATERYTGGHKYARQSKDWHKTLAKFFETLPLSNRHKLMEQAWQYARAEMEDKYKGLLYDYCFIDARLKEFGVGDLISDYAYSEDKAVKLLRDFHTLSEHILAFDPSQLASQLWGRMADFEDDDVKRLLKQAVDVKKERKEVWLRPKKACMPSPGSGLVRILQYTKTKTSAFDFENFILVPDGHSILYIDHVTSKLTMTDIRTGKTLKTFGIDAKRITIDKNGRHIAFVDSDNKVGIFDLSTGKIRYFKDQPVCDGDIYIDFNGNIVAAQMEDDDNDVIQIWDTVTLKCLASIKELVGTLCFKLTADGTKLITVYSDEPVSIWDTVTGECLNKYEIAFENLYFDEKSDVIYAHKKDQLKKDHLIAFRPSTGEQLYSKPDDLYANENISPDYKYIARGFSGISLIDTSTGEKLFTLPNSVDYNNNIISFSPDGKTILCVSGNYKIGLWDINTRDYIGGFLGHSAYVNKALMTSDGRYVVSSANDNTIKIWDMNHIAPNGVKKPRPLERLEMFGDKYIITDEEINKFWMPPYSLYAYNALTVQKHEFFQFQQQAQKGRLIRKIDSDPVSDRVLFSYGDWVEIRTLSSGELISEILAQLPAGDKKAKYKFENAKLFDNGNKVITVSYEQAFVYDANTGEILYSFETFGSRWKLLSDRKRILTHNGYAYNTRIWDIYTQKEIFQFDKIKKHYSLFEILHDESAIIIFSDGELSKWDLTTGLEMDKPVVEYEAIISEHKDFLSKNYIANGGFLLSQHLDYLWIWGEGNMPLIALVNYKTGRTMTYLHNELIFEQVVCTSDSEHFACLNKGELSFLQLENMDWDNAELIPLITPKPIPPKTPKPIPPKAPEPIPPKAPEPQQPEPPQPTPKEKPKGFFAKLFGKK
jgi:WD40 repeat protein